MGERVSKAPAVIVKGGMTRDSAVNGHLSNGHAHINGESSHKDLFAGRTHPQVSFAETGEQIVLASPRG